MIKTIQGHFQEGRFIPQEPITIPEYVEVVVVVTDSPIADTSHKQQVAHDVAYTSQHNPRILRDADPSKSVVFGRLKDSIIIPDDFDEPLEEMMEYMY